MHIARWHLYLEEFNMTWMAGFLVSKEHAAIDRHIGWQLQLRYRQVYDSLSHCWPLDNLWLQLDTRPAFWSFLGCITHGFNLNVFQKEAVLISFIPVIFKKKSLESICIMSWSKNKKFLEFHCIYIRYYFTFLFLCWALSTTLRRDGKVKYLYYNHDSRAAVNTWHSQWCPHGIFIEQSFMPLHYKI